jgi:hypothetical protein
MASLLDSRPRLGHMDHFGHMDHLAPLPHLGHDAFMNVVPPHRSEHFGFGAGFMPAEAPAPVFSSSVRERVLLLANQLVVSAGVVSAGFAEPAMTVDTAAIVRALCDTLLHVRASTPPTPTRFGPRPTVFMPTVLSAPAWPSSINVGHAGA